jgi:hypothetical protein
MMRKVVIAVIFGLLPAAGCHRGGVAAADRSRAVNPAFATAYVQACRNLTELNLNPDQAIRTLNPLRKQDTGNAMTPFLLAAAYARKQDWANVTRELGAGNKAPLCVQYLKSTGPFELNAAYFLTLNQLARDAAAAAPGLGVARGAALLQSLRKMAKKVAASEPQGLIPVVSGTKIRIIVDKPLVALYEKAGRTAEAQHARTVQEADKQWKQQAQSDFDPAFRQTADLGALSVRYGVTRDEIQAFDSGQNLSPETQRKFAAMTEFIAATEKPLAEKWLKTMPD